MSRPKPDFGEREQRILNAAIELILRQGYEKTTLGDVATEAGISRGVVYLHFRNKDNLFETLLFREVKKYNHTLMKNFEADTSGGSIAGVFSAVIHALNQSPFISAMMKQDQRVFGNYLRKPGNLFESIRTDELWIKLLTELQQIGAVRADIQTSVFAHVMTSLSLGLMVSEANKRFGNPPPLEETLEIIAVMIERALAPDNGGNPEAARAIILGLAKVSLARFEQSNQISSEGRKSSREQSW